MPIHRLFGFSETEVSETEQGWKRVYGIHSYVSRRAMLNSIEDNVYCAMILHQTRRQPSATDLY